MLKEDYCSEEVAKLLKEKEFDGQTHGNMIEIPCVSYITHQMAMKWLREVHKLSIEISSTMADVSLRWAVCVYEIGKTDDFVEAYIGTYDTYEDAVEAALKYCLTELI